MLVPSLWKHPPISGLTKFLNPPFAGSSQAFSCLGDPPKSKTLLNVPPIFYFITPFLNFSGVQRERERKTTPFLKEISGWKVKYPPFLQFSGRTLSHEKYPFTGDFGNTHAVPPTPEWGGGGRAGKTPTSKYYSMYASEQVERWKFSHFCIQYLLFLSLFLLVLQIFCRYNITFNREILGGGGW